jgi:hypothetical protein
MTKTVLQIEQEIAALSNTFNAFCSRNTRKHLDAYDANDFEVVNVAMSQFQASYASYTAKSTELWAALFDARKALTYGVDWSAYNVNGANDTDDTTAVGVLPACYGPSGVAIDDYSDELYAATTDNTGPDADALQQVEAKDAAAKIMARVSGAALRRQLQQLEDDHDVFFVISWYWFGRTRRGLITARMADGFEIKQTYIRSNTRFDASDADPFTFRQGAKMDALQEVADQCEAYLARGF